MTGSRGGLSHVTQRVRSCFWCVAMLGLLSPAVAGAAGLAALDARDVYKVVEAQLDAVAADEAEPAFSSVSASIRAQLGDAANFMAMLRSGYPMVLRPVAVSFLRPRADHGAKRAKVAARQKVLLRDREGALWTATHLFEQQAGTGRRIGGCVAVAGSGKSLI